MVKTLLTSIAKSCEQFQAFSQAPFRFRASISLEEIIFIHEIVIDLMWLKGLPIIHVVDTHKRFQNAAVLRGKASNDILLSFGEFWVSVYTGYPSVLRLAQESGFTPCIFRELATAHGIQLHLSGTQSHNSIVSGEQYHDPLRWVFRILRSRYKNLGPEIILQYSIKDLNNIVGPNGL